MYANMMYSGTRCTKMRRTRLISTTRGTPVPQRGHSTSVVERDQDAASEDERAHMSSCIWSGNSPHGSETLPER